MKQFLIIYFLSIIFNGVVLSQDTTLVRLSVVDKNKRTLVTETTLKDGVEITTKQHYDKAAAETRILNLTRQLESDSLMINQYETMLTQIRDEIQKTRRNIRTNTRIRSRLEGIIEHL